MAEFPRIISIPFPILFPTFCEIGRLQTSNFKSDVWVVRFGQIGRLFDGDWMSDLRSRDVQSQTKWKKGGEKRMAIMRSDVWDVRFGQIGRVRVRFIWMSNLRSKRRPISGKVEKGGGRGRLESMEWECQILRINSPMSDSKSDVLEVQSGEKRPTKETYERDL